MLSRRSRLSAVVVLLAVVVALGGVAAPGASPAGAQAFDTLQVAPVRNVSSARVPIADISPRGNGGQFAWGIHLEDGTDWGYSPCHPGDTFYSVCPAGPFGYYRADHWTANSVSEISPQITIPNNVGGQNTQWANKTKGARIEIYPYGSGGIYDPFTQNVGGVAISAFGVDNAGNGPNLGVIKLPVLGSPGVGRLQGNVVSRTPIGAGRLLLDAFQEHGEYDNYPYTNTSTGFPEGGFVNTKSKGGNYTTGAVWNGQYHLFLTDTRGTPSDGDDIKLQAIVVIQGEQTLTIDLDATCFGFDECQYERPNPFTPELTTGGYHPVTPARIMDTRDGTGRVFNAVGPVGPGDGAVPGEPNPFVRAVGKWNHEAKVTGVGGVPSSGVSAVVLNVTATGASENTHVSIYPKPPRTFLYDDQASFGPGTVPNASNLNVSPGQTIPNLVVVRVGAGGMVRMRNNAGATHLIFDVVGWFDTGGLAGDTFTGITPNRILDTRPTSNVGPYATRFGAAEDRQLVVTGGDVPADATGVVLNVTALNATQTSHLTVYPAGVGRPNVSNLNFGLFHVVPNLVMVKVGVDGKIRIFNNSGATDVLVDVVGYYRAGGTGRFTPTASPVRILDTRTGAGTGGSGTAKVGPADTRTLQVAGANGIPGGATAVIMNVTVTGPTTGSHLTVFPDGVPMPKASNLNFFAGMTVPNLVMVKLGTGGRVQLYNNSGATHVIADVAGYITA